MKKNIKLLIYYLSICLIIFISGSLTGVLLTSIATENPYIQKLQVFAKQSGKLFFSTREQESSNVNDQALEISQNTSTASKIKNTDNNTTPKIKKIKRIADEMDTKRITR